MKRHYASAIGMLVIALTVFGCAQYSPSQGWVTLIDGDTGMDNWNPTGSNANWRSIMQRTKVAIMISSSVFFL